jgi:hypothetical protein
LEISFYEQPQAFDLKTALAKPVARGAILDVMSYKPPQAFDLKNCTGKASGTQRSNMLGRNMPTPKAARACHPRNRPILARRRRIIFTFALIGRLRLAACPA